MLDPLSNSLLEREVPESSDMQYTRLSKRMP